MLSQRAHRNPSRAYMLLRVLLSMLAVMVLHPFRPGCLPLGSPVGPPPVKGGLPGGAFTLDQVVQWAIQRKAGTTISSSLDGIAVYILCCGACCPQGGRWPAGPDEGALRRAAFTWPDEGIGPYMVR